MDKFEQVTVLKAANIYYDGKVSSRVVQFQDGSRKTLGIMLPGQYEFSTDTQEVMEIVSGQLRVLLPDATEWLEIDGAGEFTVPAGTTFKLDIRTVTDYCCSYA
ncbi:pyrimidine/purine nucleoside phosphorylase [Xylanibacillus composti]|nr:pyrimidine/purine nucleoside phosphorylase [Xylanibacillus composti]MDT9724614.1 pyrimidine/purine nucleoside phosphorylase [Xylanibacillus composti]